MMVFARGLAKYVSGGMKVSTAVQNADGTYRYVDVPAVFRHRHRGSSATTVGGDVIFLVCAAAGVDGPGAAPLGPAPLRHRRQRGGRAALRRAGRAGQDPGLRASRRACAAVAGICQAAQEQQGDPEAGVGYELTAIAMVVIGGTNLMGGRGGIGLTLLGVLTIGYLEKILCINAVPEASRLMLTGVIIVAAVLAQRRQTELTQGHVSRLQE